VYGDIVQRGMRRCSVNVCVPLGKSGKSTARPPPKLCAMLASLGSRKKAGGVRKTKPPWLRAPKKEWEPQQDPWLDPLLCLL
jgi:hypothetical protein